MQINSILEFLKLIETSIEESQFIKLTISGQRPDNKDIKAVYVKLISIKSIAKLSFVYRYPTKDTTKNYDVHDGLIIIEKLLETEFFQINFFTKDINYHLMIGDAGTLKLNSKKNTTPAISQPIQSHDHQKKRWIEAGENYYLSALGILSEKGEVKKDKQDKFKQINRYVEIIDGILKDVQLESDFHIVDMGSGKGYLTFALYDYLRKKQIQPPFFTGIELRAELVDLCNNIAIQSNFEHLKFVQGNIQNSQIEKVDMLIALHACDTATDDAIAKGINLNSKIIICAPCCHKQIRGQMNPDNALQSITRHGILLERQAEMVTDAIRALILEAYGYKTKVFEFIELNHTPKNVLIVGIKNKDSKEIDQSKLDKIKALKALFNIDFHYLERALGLNLIN